MATASDNPSYYVGHVAPALVQHTVSAEAKIVAVTLLMHRNSRTGLCYVKQKTLARELQLSETRSIRRCLNELKASNLIDWEERAAPRGEGKGRTRSYDLSGLLALSTIPIRPASDFDGAETAPTKRSVVNRDGAQTLPRDGAETSPRDGAEMLPHASGNRPITETRNSNQTHSNYLSSLSCNGTDSDSVDSVGTVLVEPKTERDGAETLPHSARIAGAEYRQNLVAPGGTPYADAPLHESGYNLAPQVVKSAGGEKFNPGRLERLCDEHGNELVWFHAKWFLRRLASLRKPPERVTPYFIACVERDLPVNPNWPEFHRPSHARLSDELRELLSDAPTTDSPELWAEWLEERDGRLIQDVPPQLRQEVTTALVARLRAA